jgi:hypothetical protein
MVADLGHQNKSIRYNEINTVPEFISLNDIFYCYLYSLCNNTSFTLCSIIVFDGDN